MDLLQAGGPEQGARKRCASMRPAMKRASRSCPSRNSGPYRSSGEQKGRQGVYCDVGLDGPPLARNRISRQL